jgi:hypothetical protein
MKKLLLLIAVILLTAVVTWRVTILSLSITVSEDTAYITSFGQTDKFDYTPLW